MQKAYKIYSLDGKFIEKIDVIPDNFTGIFENEYGSKYWYLNGNLHRLNGPAIEYSDGEKEWIINGKLHRIDGPAREWYNRHKEWWIDGNKITELQCKCLYDMMKLKGLI